ncbi:photosynthetic NDH subunit of subcomplex B 4, chloroplastic isoform X1 [Nymphaea colorata]|nr:photosynthetic NDH subunit of subcomplex B 4, chloroplastic isoform X1 [Nymphaea colorata]
MADAIMSVRIASSLHLIHHRHHLPMANCTSIVTKSSSRSLELKKSICFPENQRREGQRREKWRIQAFPDWPLLAVLVQHVEGERDVILHKAVWHLNDEALKSVYTMYIMFTCWGCCVFGSTKDPYYDSEQYRKDGGDGTGFWLYDKQEDIEEAARAQLWREELIEEIEQKVEGLRGLQEVSKKNQEELVN